MSETYCATFSRIVLKNEFEIIFSCINVVLNTLHSSHFVFLLNWLQIYGLCDLCGQANFVFLTLVCNSLNLKSKSHFSISPSELKME